LLYVAPGVMEGVRRAVARHGTAKAAEIESKALVLD